MKAVTAIIAVLVTAAWQWHHTEGADGRPVTETHTRNHNGIQKDCTLGSHVFGQAFRHLADNMDNSDAEGCNATCSMLSSDVVHEILGSLMLQLNLTSNCCWSYNESNCTHSEDRPDSVKAYGYGFLMVVLVSATSVLGIVIVPLVRGSRFKHLYKYVYALMISLGASALFCDAVLHLIPEAFEIHSHAVHNYESTSTSSINGYLWKGCAVIGGMYVFFLLEVFLHSWTDVHVDGEQKCNVSKVSTSEDASNLIDGGHEPAVGGGRGYGAASDAGVATSSVSHSDTTQAGCFARVYRYFCRIKPLAWIIIIGDALHNFADGLALGAAISQSLALGISTTMALVFHEIPHELGDFAILLSTGMHWGVALAFNILSSVTAIAGFFIGVTVGTKSEEANAWILAVTAGIFLYIALVDLLPVLIHSKEKGCVRCGVFVVSNIGFALSFAVLLVIAYYEEDLDKLVD